LPFPKAIITHPGNLGQDNNLKNSPSQQSYRSNLRLDKSRTAEALTNSGEIQDLETDKSYLNY
jgi:hypothetical protein